MQCNADTLCNWAQAAGAECLVAGVQHPSMERPEGAATGNRLRGLLCLGWFSTQLSRGWSQKGVQVTPPILEGQCATENALPPLCWLLANMSLQWSTSSAHTRGQSAAYINPDGAQLLRNSQQACNELCGCSVKTGAPHSRGVCAPHSCSSPRL